MRDVPYRRLPDQQTFGQVLSWPQWGVRRMFALGIICAMLLFEYDLRAPRDGRQGMLSAPVECAAYAATLKDWPDFFLEYWNSYAQPDSAQCKALVDASPNDPHLPLAYSIALARQREPESAVAVLRKSAEGGGYAAAHALAAMHLNSRIAAALKFEHSSTEPLAILDRLRVERNAETYMLYFKAYNSSPDVNKSRQIAFLASHNLLRALSLGSKQAQFFMATTPPEDQRLAMMPKWVIKVLLKEFGFLDIQEPRLPLTIDDYVALAKFIQAKPIFEDEGCITVRDLKKCFQF